MNKEQMISKCLMEVENLTRSELIELAQQGYSGYLESLDDVELVEEFQYRVQGLGKDIE